MTDPSKTQDGYGSSWIQDLIGQTLDGRYQIDDFVGQGAMGVVFRARQLRLRRAVAIKIPRPDLAHNPEFLARFEREALTMAKMVHENIVQVIDVFVSKDATVPSFIVMEFVQGEALDTFLQAQRHSLTLAAVLDLFAQIARAIDSAHAHGVVHRDIKPENIVVTLPQRVPKIMDFGIARVDMEDVFRTTESAAIGTPAFMSPEQIAGADVTGAADIYAFGMTIYSLLARQLPFDANTATALLFAHANEDPIPIHERNPVLPERLSVVLGRALDKKPDSRQGSAQELVHGIQESLAHLAKRPFSDLLLEETATVQVSPRPPEIKPNPPSLQPGGSPPAAKKKGSWKTLGCATAAGLVLLCLLLTALHRITQERLAEAVPVEERLEAAEDWGLFPNAGRIDIKRLKNMNLDLVFLPPSLDGTVQERIPRYMVTDLRATGTIVVAYLDCSEANGTETSPLLQSALKQGFDGACLANLDPKKDREEIIGWVDSLAETARDKDPDFLLFQGGYPRIIFSPGSLELDKLGERHLENVDGIVLDRVVFDGLTRRPSDELEALERMLSPYTRQKPSGRRHWNQGSQGNRRKVLLMEFIYDSEYAESQANRERTDWFRSWAKERDFVPCVMPIEKGPEALERGTPSAEQVPGGTVRLEGVRRWIQGGLAQDVSIEDWERAAAGLIVLNPFRSSAYEGPYKREDVQRIRASGKRVLALLSLTHADMTCWYGQAFNPMAGGDAPSWLGPAQDRNPHLRWVRYWDPEWRRVLLGDEDLPPPSSVDRILDAGFDGIVIAGIEGLEYWSEETDEIQQAEARRELVKLVEGLRERLERTGQGPPPLLIGPVLRAMLESWGETDAVGTSYLRALDGVLVARLLFEDGELLPAEELAKRMRALKAVRTASGGEKPVLIQEFVIAPGPGNRPQNMGRIKEYVELCERHGLIFSLADVEGDMRHPILGAHDEFDRKTLHRWRDRLPRNRALKARKP